jgi:hypothetical protein
VFLGIDSRRSFWRAVMSDVTGLTMIRQFLRFREKDLVSSGERRSRALAVVGPVAALAVAIFLGRLDAALIYYATLATPYPPLNRLRTYGQHVTVDKDGRSHFDGSGTSRTIDAGLIDRTLYTSPRPMYCYEHVYPHLPYRGLKGLVVREIDFNRYTRSRWQVLRAIYRGLPR